MASTLTFEGERLYHAGTTREMVAGGCAGASVPVISSYREAERSLRIVRRDCVAIGCSHAH